MRKKPVQRRGPSAPARPVLLRATIARQQLHTLAQGFGAFMGPNVGTQADFNDAINRILNGRNVIVTIDGVPAFALTIAD